MDHPFVLPGYPDLNLSLRPGGFFGTAKILKDGVLLKKTKGITSVPLEDGSFLELKTKTGADPFGPKVVFAGEEIEVLPPVSPWWQMWAYLPFLLIFVGGLVGGLCGGAGAYGTLAALRSNLPAWARIVIALLAPPLSILLYLAIAIFFTLKFRTHH